MFTLSYGSRFTRKLKRLIKKSPRLKKPIDRALDKIELDPFERSLKTHKVRDKKGRGDAI